nr:hypothetical protein [Campylobacter troglodytis]
MAFLSALLSSLSLADDFLAKLTNGALSDNLAGVKKLTLDEASQVVGGYLVKFYTLRDTKLWNVSISEMVAVIDLSRAEFEGKGVCYMGVSDCRIIGADGNKFFTSSAKDNYRELASVADPQKREYLAVSVTQIFSKANPYRPTLNYVVNNVVLGVSNKGSIYKLRNTYGNKMTMYVRSTYEKAMKNHLAYKLLR